MRERIFLARSAPNQSQRASPTPTRHTGLLKCPHCEQVFRPSRSWSRFCSEPCRRDHERLAREVGLEILRHRGRVVVDIKPGGIEVSEQLPLSIPPASRRTNPDTSKQAEARAPISKQAQQLYAALQQYGPGTMHEIAAASGMDYYVCQKRISVLARNGLAVRIGEKRNPGTGNNCAVWRVE